MFIDPNEDIPERIKKLRQANFKLVHKEYKQRMGSGGAPARGRQGKGQGQRRRKAAAYDTDDDSDMD